MLYPDGSPLMTIFNSPSGFPLGNPGVAPAPTPIDHSPIPLGGGSQPMPIARGPGWQNLMQRRQMNWGLAPGQRPRDVGTTWRQLMMARNQARRAGGVSRPFPAGQRPNQAMSQAGQGGQGGMQAQMQSRRLPNQQAGLMPFNPMSLQMMLQPRSVQGFGRGQQGGLLGALQGQPQQQFSY